MINSYPTSPTMDQTRAVITLAAIHDIEIVRRVVVAVSNHIVSATAIDPNDVVALSVAVRLATNASRYWHCSLSCIHTSRSTCSEVPVFNAVML
jgi:hypothetical protein